MNYQELQDEIKNAMKSHDKQRVSILRLLHGEIKNIEINERREITDEDVLNMLKRLIKQTSETLEASIKANNNEERTQSLQEQVDILKEYLPEQLCGDALSQLITQVIEQSGATSKKDIGKIMGMLGAKTSGNFDKAEAAQILGTKLS